MRQIFTISLSILWVSAFFAFSSFAHAQNGEEPPLRFKLEETRTIMGTNPFDAKSIESIGLGNDSYHNSSSPPSTDSSLPPVDPFPSTSDSGTTPTGAGPATSGTSSTPFSVSTSGSISFSHTVRQSTCPQQAGGVTLTASNGGHLHVTNVSASGSIGPYLDLSVVSDGTTQPFIAASFNCETSSPGSYSGTVSATATDTSTGESQNISVPASGQIN